MPKAGDQSQQILKYLKEANRPYSANDITLNLQLKKAATVKTMQDLAADGTVAFKENGKQVIYYMPQEDNEQTQEEVDAEKQLIASLEEEIQELKTQEHGNALRIQELEKYPGDAELAESIAAINAQTAELQETLSEHQKQPMDPKEKDRINKAYSNTMKLWKTRKGKCMGIVNELCDKMDKKPSELMELIGLETDEDCGQSYSEYSKYI